MVGLATGPSGLLCGVAYDGAVHVFLQRQPLVAVSSRVRLVGGALAGVLPDDAVDRVLRVPATMADDDDLYVVLAPRRVPRLDAWAGLFRVGSDAVSGCVRWAPLTPGGDGLYAARLGGTTVHAGS